MTSFVPLGAFRAGVSFAEVPAPAPESGHSANTGESRTEAGSQREVTGARTPCCPRSPSHLEGSPAERVRGGLGQVKSLWRPHSSLLANKGEVIENNEAEGQCITGKDAPSRLGGVGEQVKKGVY